MKNTKKQIYVFLPTNDILLTANLVVRSDFSFSGPWLLQLTEEVFSQSNSHRWNIYFKRHFKFLTCISFVRVFYCDEWAKKNSRKNNWNFLSRIGKEICNRPKLKLFLRKNALKEKIAYTKGTSSNRLNDKIFENMFVSNSLRPLKFKNNDKGREKKHVSTTFSLYTFWRFFVCNVVN